MTAFSIVVPVDISEVDGRWIATLPDGSTQDLGPVEAPPGPVVCEAVGATAGAADAGAGGDSSTPPPPPPPDGDLTDATLSQDWLYHDALVGASVAKVQGVGGPVTSVEFEAGDDEGGRFTIVGDEIRTASAWEGFFDTRTPRLAVPDFTLNLRINGALVKAFVLRPRFRKIDFDVTGPESPVTNLTELRAILNNTASGGKVGRIPKSVIGTPFMPANGSRVHVITSTPSAKRQRVKIIGHRQVYLTRRGSIWFGGTPGDHESESEDFIFFNCTMNVGGEPEGYNFDDRDNMCFRNLKRGLLANCTILGGVDECLSIISSRSEFRPPKHIRLHRVLAAMPTVSGGQIPWHNEGDHPVGVLMGEGGEIDLVIDKSALGPFTERLPVMSIRCVGMNAQNNLFIYHGGPSGATRGMGIGRRSAGYPFGSAMYRANLGYTTQGHRTDLTATELKNTREHFIAFNANPDSDYVGSPGRDKFYIPEGTPFDNIAFMPPRGRFGRPTAEHDRIRITRADIGNRGPNKVGMLVDRQPYETDMDDELMATETLADQQSLWDDVWENVGCRELDANDDPLPGIMNVGQLQYEHMVALLTGQPGSRQIKAADVKWPTTVPG